MPKVNETWALAKSTVNYFCRLMNGAEITAQEIIVLAGLVAQKKATVEVVGELHEDGNEERALSVKRPSHCQYTGERGADCEYTITFASLRSIKATCAEQIAALTQTIEAIDSLLPQDAPAPKKARAKAA
jgi:hypothetical protein